MTSGTASADASVGLPTAGTQPGAVAVPDSEQAYHAWRMRHLIYGHIQSRAVCAMAEFGLADMLSAGPLPVAELADRVGADAVLLARLLRALACFEVLRLTRRDGRDCYELTPLGETLRSDAPASALPTALLVSSTVAPAWDRLPDVVRTGRPAFADIFGQDFFSYLGGDPELRAVFDRSQETGLALEMEGVLSAVEFTGLQSVVDVGGGDGALLTALLEAHAHLRGVLVDLPAALPAAARRLAAAGLQQRCELHEGDFFGTLFKGGDLYVLRHILHDWDDDSCRAVLRTCRVAMAPGARLVVIDHLAARDPETARPGDDEGRTGQGATAPGTPWGALMDLYMMSLFSGGRERSQDEVAGLLRDTGFTVVRVTRLPGDTGIVEARVTEPAAAYPEECGADSHDSV